MNNIRIHCSWGLNFDFFHDKQIELYVDSIPYDSIPHNTVRFLFLLEPPEIMDLTSRAFTAYRNGYVNVLLTHNQYLLDNCPNSFNFPLGSTWIKNYEFPEKEYSVSTLVGGKLMANGHHLRQHLWGRQNEINTIKRNFFISGNHSGRLKNLNNNPVLGDKKDPLFNSQFHIVIENAIRQNWFTEKLIDTLQTKTIPIYIGCPNIDNWFDTKGMFIVNNVDEIISTCNNLTPDTYNNMIEYVEKNYEISKNYSSLEDRLITHIKNYLNM
jgi:hypothetical protein